MESRLAGVAGIVLGQPFDRHDCCRDQEKGVSDELDEAGHVDVPGS